ncbi:hypothetical protein SAOR_00990 [Salinisphaera orenii MK-B5]|uniref:Uncharacterized protein n=1 Tax=Salinisphaera orenii MK-B5 TaxID=856730 RepID=A0A423PYJ2_9GAMM|nr:hypothetical protein [Salinisphaera orenii]ROO30598.1 hypothetical protein SAOR_00990 [Salinisphaera orenii MK-B5]
MSKAQDIEQALGLLREQIEDENLAAKDRQTAAKAVLSHYKESVNHYQGKGAKDQKKDSAVEAAERLKLVK